MDCSGENRPIPLHCARLGGGCYMDTRLSVYVHPYALGSVRYKYTR